MSDTLLYSGEGTYNDKYVHVMAYQNSAYNLSNVANAMILPFPTSQEMNENNIIDTTTFSSFLKNISDATKLHSKMLGGFALNSDKLGSRSFKVFDKGSYTVVLANDLNKIQDALQFVPEHKRPIITDEFLEGYGSLYKDLPVAICCWAGNVKAEPLLWWYEPKDKETFFIPTMDAHDGKAPMPRVTVDTDHIISVGSAVNDLSTSKVYYNQKIPTSVAGLLPTSVYGTKINFGIPNGDMWIDVRQPGHFPLLNRGLFNTREVFARDIRMDGWY
jgi:hypothetical protein